MLKGRASIGFDICPLQVAFSLQGLNKVRENGPLRQETILLTKGDLETMDTFSPITHCYAFFGSNIVEQWTADLLANSESVVFFSCVCLRKNALLDVGLWHPDDTDVYWIPGCKMQAGNAYLGAAMPMTIERKDRVRKVLAALQRPIEKGGSHVTRRDPPHTNHMTRLFENLFSGANPDLETLTATRATANAHHDKFLLYRAEQAKEPRACTLPPLQPTAEEKEKAEEKAARAAAAKPKKYKTFAKCDEKEFRRQAAIVRVCAKRERELEKLVESLETQLEEALKKKPRPKLSIAVGLNEVVSSPSSRLLPVAHLLDW
jgi:hypothetical protein